jgi:cation diffusion facilitator family transporter
MDFRIESSAPAARSAAETEKQGAATSSVLAAVFLTVIKIVVGVLSGSLGMLAEAAHSALDLVAAVVTFLAVRVSDRPADADHTYGHGKIENFSALIEALLLVVTCIWIVYEAIDRIFLNPHDVDASVWTFITMGVSVVVNSYWAKMLYAAGRKHNSQALEADALHHATDVWSSWVVLAGLAIVWAGHNFFPAYDALLGKADALAGVGVAVIILFVTYDLGKSTIDVLLDRAPAGIPQKIAQAAAQDDRVLEVAQVRVRRSGPGLFVDMTIAVDRNLSFENTHSVAEAVARRVQEVAPGADVVVHTDPRENERESIAVRCRAVAARQQVAVHNISVQDSGGRLNVDLHLEVDDHLSLRQAHAITKRLEGDLRMENPSIARVNTHIESRGTGIGNGEDVTAQEGALAAEILAAANAALGQPGCHDVRIRRQGVKLAASLHCAFDPELPIPQVHEQSTRVEMRLLDTFPALDRVLVHAEPADGSAAPT